MMPATNQPCGLNGIDSIRRDAADANLDDWTD
jgi:hypothetical protein